MMNLTGFRRRLGIKSFLLCVSLCALGYMIHVTVFMGAVRMIEKQFGLSARQTGILYGSEYSMKVAFVLVYGYIGDRYSKPKLLGFSTALMSVSSVIMTLPHFIIAAPNRYQTALNETTTSGYLNGSISVTGRRLDIMCTTENKTCMAESSVQDIATSTAGTTAFYILVVARVIYGTAAASVYNLGIAYVYENAEEHSRSLYIGIFGSLYAAGPIIGYLVAGYTNRLPVDLKDYRLKPTDPRFIGCWWLGFIIVAVVGVIGSVPLSLFPANLKPVENHQENPKREKEYGFMAYIKDFGRTIRQMILNPLITLYVTGNIVLAYVVILFFKMLPRYLEVYFRIPVYQTNLIIGASMTVPAIIGSILGGFIPSRFKLKEVAMIRMYILGLLGAALSFALMMAVQCPQVNFVGFHLRSSDESITMSSNCTSQCACDTSGIQPVCGSDGRDYFTPCHAGCTNSTVAAGKVNFTSCGCIPGGWAVPGNCLSTCSSVIPYILLQCVVSFCGASLSSPSKMVFMSATPKSSRAFGLAFGSFMYYLFGFLPGPVLAGSLVDHSCHIWQERCGRRGSCLLYNIDLLRAYTHGGSVLFTLVSCSILSIALCIVSRRAKVAKRNNHIENSDLNDEAAEEVLMKGDPSLEPNSSNKNVGEQSNGMPAARTRDQD